MKRININYYWRLFATLLSFTLFGIGGLILSVTVFPLLYILPINKASKVIIARYIARTSFRFFIGFMKYFGVLTYDINNAERLKSQKGLFIVANHPTLIDVVFLVSIANIPNCVVKRGVWRNPCMYFVVSSAGFIENNGDPELMIDRCQTALKSGDGLILFPEGTRTDPDSDIRMKRGVAHIALHAQKNLTPVTITCEPITLTRKHRWYHIPLEKPPHFCINVESDIHIQPYLDNNVDHAHNARALTHSLRQAFKV